MPVSATRWRNSATLLGRQRPRPPLPRRLREDLQRLAARGLGAIHRARQPAGDRHVRTEPRHGYRAKAGQCVVTAVPHVHIGIQFIRQRLRRRSGRRARRAARRPRAGPPSGRSGGGTARRPAPLGRDLRQQQAAPSALLDHEPWRPIDDGRRRPSGSIALQRPEHRDLDAQRRAAPPAAPAGSADPRSPRRRRSARPLRRRPRLHCSVPRQPRSSPRRLIVTNTPDAVGQRSMRPAPDGSPAKTCAATPRGRSRAALLLRVTEHRVNVPNAAAR